jgi:hypothetical protein
MAGEPAQAASTDGDLAQTGADGIDVQRLADLVYRLMLAEVRLGQARGESLSESAANDLQ